MKATDQNFLKVAQKAALLAGRFLLSRYGKLKRSQIHTKSKNDFVTDVDRQSEKMVIGTIKKYFPAHSIQAEESGISGDNSTCWIIDPLDGTSNYIHQLPVFSVSIAVKNEKGLRAGVIYDPIHQELFSSLRGHGAFLNNERISVTRTRRLSGAFMATGIPFRARGRFEGYLKSLGIISLRTVGLRRGGSAALDLAYVACGRFDGFWEMKLSPWDIAAGALLIREAGGKITDMWNRDRYLANGDVLASNGRIHKELCAITSACIAPLDTQAGL